MLPIGILGFVALLFFSIKRTGAVPDPSPSEIAQTISDFTEGKGAPYEWDDFTAIPLKDPSLETIRVECFEIGVKFPGRNKEWCSEEGVQKLREISSRLKRKN